jgi:hypothetical protein
VSTGMWLDSDNCPSLTGVLNVSQVLYLVDRWVRISLIFYMRKALHDILIRRLACMELATKCSGFLDRCEVGELGEQKFCALLRH